MSLPNHPFAYPFKPGDLVSTEERFHRREDYKQAVLDHKGEYDESSHSYSIAQPGDQEWLLMHQPSHNYPSDCIIKFYFSPEVKLRPFQDTYERKTKFKGHKEVEYPGEGFRGEMDWLDTHRSISLPPGISPKKAVAADYECLIINPPYPRFGFGIGKARPTAAPKYWLGAVGIATAFALTALVISRKRP